MTHYWELLWKELSEENDIGIDETESLLDVDES